MSVAFSRTTRSLRTDRPVGAMLVIFITIGFLSIWMAWLLLSRVSVYARSTSARLEAGTASYPIQTLFAGRIARNNLVLGRSVRKGEVLLELDATPQRLQLMEEQTQRNSLALESKNLHRALAAELNTVEEERKAAQLAVAEARTKLREAEATAAYANLEAERKGKLYAERLLSQMEMARLTAEANRHNALLESLRLAINRQEAEQLARANERTSRVEALRREINRLAGERSRLGAALDRLTSEVDLRRILSHVDGRIGEIATLRVGDVIPAGERVGAVIPDDKLKVVAHFDPATALGRVQAGQPARLRLEGFPWTQYGTLSARVTGIAKEIRDGQIRVELDPGPGFRVPLQHGLPGSTEIEIERVSPAVLLLRTAGHMLASKASPPQPRTTHNMPRGAGAKEQ